MPEQPAAAPPPEVSEPPAAEPDELPSKPDPDLIADIVKG